jgi:exonuclease VII small subunit
MTSAQQLPLPEGQEGAPGSGSARPAASRGDIPPQSIDDISTLPFEALLARLESNISLLAEGSAPLDELVTAHQHAAGFLAEAERRLESLKARADQLVVALKS